MTSRLALLLACVPSIAAAHPGHGDTSPHQWSHYLTEPLHIAVLAGSAFAVVIAGGAWRRARRRRKAS
jgi:hypothetical protein